MPELQIFFFLKAEDGIRDLTVTGVQTCALPISVADPLPLTMATTPASIALPGVALPPTRTRPWYLDVWVQMLRRKPLGSAGAVIVVVMLAAAVLADVIVPYGYAQTSLRGRFIVMDPAHWLGTNATARR